MRSRLVLVTPLTLDPTPFAQDLAAALSGGDVASLIIAPKVTSDMALQRIAETLTPIAQQAGAAVMVANDTRAMGRAKADGLHVDGGIAALKDAISSVQPRGMVGAAHLKTRHDAMEAGEAGADYVFFGFLDKEEGPDTHPKSLELGEWWASMFEPASIVLAGSTLESIDEAADTGADFIAVRMAVWAHPEGPAAAVKEANRRLDLVAERRKAEMA